MRPWDFFGFSKHGFDPFKYLNDSQLQKMMDQLSNQSLLDQFSPFFSNQNNKQSQSKEQMNSNQTLNESVFETHDDIFIRIPISDEKKLNKIKIYYSLNKCMIDGYHDHNTPYTIVLPATVKKKGAKALYKEGILEIKIPKNLDWQISQIDVNKY